MQAVIERRPPNVHKIVHSSIKMTLNEGKLEDNINFSKT